jgi:hypothetical protein
MLSFGDFGINRKGRVQCPACGTLMTFQVSEYPEGPNGESIFVPEYGCSIGMTHGFKILKEETVGTITSETAISCDNDCPLPVTEIVDELESSQWRNAPEIQMALPKLRAKISVG